MSSRGVPGAVLLAALLVAPTLARADVLPAGALRGGVLVQSVDSRPGADETRYGGGLMVDLWQPFGPLRVGGAAGIAAIRSDNDDANDVFLPLGASIGLSSQGGDAVVAFTGVLRVGGWAGATNAGLAGGAFLAGGVHLDVRLDKGLHASFGTDVWAVFGDGTRRVFWVPTLGISWNGAGRDEDRGP